jgi:tetratricopeptide (TPR) repeat protein
VALKVLPFAATMDPRHLQRFHNEARAAAGLHHPNIVPVFGVGCERGVHYYAMQFIEGRTLAEFIAQRRGESPAPVSTATPAAAAPASTAPPAARATSAAPRDAAYFRRAAELGIQAAEALEYAHSLGIVHRDVKPANLIVDDWGKLWVTDFGLARTATDAGLTMTGDLLGTLRYMSPEQALARHGLMDHRTDIYSLGATLFELFTGRPAVEGQDRQEILRRVADEDPRSPRALDPEVPIDLETIVLKSLAKEPAERYATAQELADDLRRFLEDRPIRARRLTLPQRLRKWGQRHRHLVGVSVTFLVLMVVGLAVSVFLIWREKEQTRETLAEARTNFAEAEAQRRRAEDNFRKAMDGAGYVFAAGYPPDGALPPTLADLRRTQAELTLEFYRGFLREGSAEPSDRLQTGIVHVTISGIYHLQGDRARTEKALSRGVAVFESLVADYPEVAVFRIELAQVHNILGLELHDRGEPVRAALEFTRAIKQFRYALRLAPEDYGALEHAAWFSVICPDVRLRNPAEAVECARKSVERKSDSGIGWSTLGAAHYRAGDYPAALAALEHSVRIHGSDSLNWFFLAMTHERLGHHEEARNYYDKAQEWRVQRNRSSNVELRLFQAEASEVLGLSGTPRSSR